LAAGTGGEGKEKEAAAEAEGGAGAAASGSWLPFAGAPFRGETARGRSGRSVRRRGRNRLYSSCCACWMVAVFATENTARGRWRCPSKGGTDVGGVEIAPSAGRTALALAFAPPVAGSVAVLLLLVAAPPAPPAPPLPCTFHAATGPSSPPPFPYSWPVSERGPTILARSTAAK